MEVPKAGHERVRRYPCESGVRGCYGALECEALRRREEDGAASAVQGDTWAWRGMLTAPSCHLPPPRAADNSRRVAHARH